MFSKVAYAMGQTAVGGAETEVGFMAMLGSLAPLLVIVGAFYLLLLRPQRRQAKLRREMLHNIKKGDAVITAGGVYARVLEAEPDKLLLDMGDFKVYVLRSTIRTVMLEGQKLPLYVSGGKRRSSKIDEE